MSKILEKITHRYRLNGLEPDDNVISMCNSISIEGMYRIHWYDNIVTRIEKMDGYSYIVSSGYYCLYSLVDYKCKETIKLASSEFIHLMLDEIRDLKINSILC